MKMEVNLRSRATLAEAADIVAAIGHENTCYLVGEPGIGKTAMHEKIVQRTGFKGIYIDVPNVELGDIGVPMPNHETKTTHFYPNEYWGFHTGEPLVIFLDEFTKGTQAVQNMFHPLLNERRSPVGKLHPETIVMLAGNLSSDGVGDVLKAHSQQRVSEIHVKKPHGGINSDGTIDKDSWGEWAVQNDVDPLVLTFVKEYPQVLASYQDGGQAENPYIFHPKKPRAPCISPRTLVKGSNVLKKRMHFSHNALRTVLEGTIGATGARDLLAYLEVADSLPTWEQITTSPQTANVPTSPAALCILAFNALQRIDRNNIGKWFEYMKRTPKELQSVFCLSAIKSDTKKSLVMTSAPFVTWMRENQYLF
jgi:hypothetical protein